MEHMLAQTAAVFILLHKPISNDGSKNICGDIVFSTLTASQCVHIGRL